MTSVAVYRKDSIKSSGAYLSETICRVGACSRGLNRGEELFKSTRHEFYHMVTKSKKISNIRKKTLLEQ